MGVRRGLVARLENLQAKGKGHAVGERVEHQRQPVGLVGQAIRSKLLQPLLLHGHCPAACKHRWSSYYTTLDAQAKEVGIGIRV